MSAGHVMHPIQDIEQLIDCGDWACSFGSGSGLRHVCHELATVTPPRIARRARVIERIAPGDVARASAQWADLVRRMHGARARWTRCRRISAVR